MDEEDELDDYELDAMALLDTLPMLPVHREVPPPADEPV